MSEKSAEHELLILAARPNQDADALSGIRPLLRRIRDWQYVLDVAQDHCVLPLLHNVLHSSGANDVPADVMARLGDLNEANASYTFCLVGELIRLLDVFKQHGIAAIPFKGPTLAMLAYGDIALRQFADLDILLHKQDMSRARKVLAAHDFNPTPLLDAGQEAALFRFDCAQNFCNQQNITLDVHWNIAPKYLAIDFDLNGLWDRVQPIQIGKHKTHTLSQEDLLIALSIHGFTHNWDRLGWVSDVAGLIERNETDWDVLLSRAARLGLRRILSVTLLLARKLLAARIPSVVLTRIELDAVAVRLANQFAQDTFSPGDDAKPLEFALLHLRMRERIRDKVVSGVRLLITPRTFDWTAFSVPASLSGLYYLTRPVRVVWRAKRLTGRRPRQQPLGPESMRQKT